MKKFLKNNGLTLVLLFLFIVMWIGQFAAGHKDYNEELLKYHKPPLSSQEYFNSGHFWQATGENWESEFLQMGFFVIFTTFLFQRGSPESNDPDNLKTDKEQINKESPWPVKKGGVILRFYKHSLSLAFMFCFIISILIHAFGGLVLLNDENSFQGLPSQTFFDYFLSAKFWFESLQNWQSEFLSLAAMVFLSVYLREDGSAQSKKVTTPHSLHG